MTGWKFLGSIHPGPGLSIAAGAVLATLVQITHLHCTAPLPVLRGTEIFPKHCGCHHHCALCRLWAGHFLGCSVQCCLWQSAVVLLSVVSLASVVCLFSKYAHIKHLKSNVCQYLMSPYLTCFAVPSMPTNKATTVNYYSN